MKNILLMIVVSFALVGSALAECGDADRKALEMFDHAWSDAGDKGDRAALMNILADDFTGMPTMVNKTQSIEGTMAAFERNKANPQDRDQVSSDNLHDQLHAVHGDHHASQRGNDQERHGRQGRNLLQPKRSFSRKARRKMAGRQQCESQPR